MNKPEPHPINAWVIDNGWLTVVASFLAILFGLLVSEVQNKIGWRSLASGLVILFLVYWLTLFTVGRPILKIMSKLRTDLMQERLRGDHGWLLDTRQLVEYEMSSKAKEIWLLTSDLLDDSQAGPFFEVVRDNLAKKVQYIYFCPDTPENCSRQESIKALHKMNPLLKCVHLPPNFFILVPKLDVVIYNPMGHQNGVKTGFMGIPVMGEVNHYHAQVSLELIDKLVGTLLPHYKRLMRSTG